MDEAEQKLKEKMIEVLVDIRGGISNLNTRLCVLNEQMLYLEDISNSLEKISDVVVKSYADHGKGENKL